MATCAHLLLSMQHQNKLIAGMALVLLLPYAVHGQAPVEVRTVGQPWTDGELVQFSLQGGLVMRADPDSDTVSIPTGEIVRIAPRSAKSTAPSGPIQLLLQNGDMLLGRLSGSGPDKFVIDTILGADIAVPFERVKRMTTALAVRPQWARRISSLSHSASPDDMLLLSNGDVIEGLLSRVEPERIVIERDGNELQVNLDVTVALLLANEPPPENTDLRAQLHFVDGSRLVASEVRWTPDGLDLTCFDGTLQGLASHQVRYLEVRGARWSWLGLDVAPSAAEQTPQMSLTWPLRQDRNVLGGTLRLRGRTYDRGIGVHSRSVLRFDLNGQYTAFTTVCGLDDAAGPLADVSAAVIADGAPRWEGRGIQRTDDPEALHIDIRGVQTLELRVEFGANGGLQDYFNWADAAFVR